jgi:hypothetical protein
MKILLNGIVFGIFGFITVGAVGLSWTLFGLLMCMVAVQIINSLR